MASGASKGRLAGFLALGALLVLLAIAFLPGGSETTPPDPAAVITTTPDVGTSLTEAIPEIDEGGLITASAEDVALSPQARLLAERFQCVCGCGDILSTCSCLQTPGSRDMKRLLQRLVDEGKSPTEIKTEMVAVYGQAALP
jgi:cytochrome c-type biogenesis protein CcmH/NrfF